MDIIMVLVIPRAATNREMAPRPPNIICFCLASRSIGFRMVSMELVRKPIRFISVSTSATWFISFTFTRAPEYPFFHSGFLPLSLACWSNKVLSISRSITSPMDVSSPFP